MFKKLDAIKIYEIAESGNTATNASISRDFTVCLVDLTDGVFYRNVLPNIVNLEGLQPETLVHLTIDRN